MKNILIIGLGNVGFYHFSSLSKKKNIKNNIFLCDKNREIKKKLDGFNYKKLYSDINTIKSLKLDIVIISTSANERLSLLKTLIKNNSCKYIIFEKIAFNSLYEISKAMELLRNYKIKSWVNCNYQTIPFFKKISQSTRRNQFEMKVFGGKWSMGTSAIHFIDFFYFLSNSPIKKITFKRTF